MAEGYKVPLTMLAVRRSEGVRLALDGSHIDMEVVVKTQAPLFTMTRVTEVSGSTFEYSCAHPESSTLNNNFLGGFFHSKNIINGTYRSKAINWCHFTFWGAVFGVTPIFWTFSKKLRSIFTISASITGG